MLFNEFFKIYFPNLNYFSVRRLKFIFSFFKIF